MDWFSRENFNRKAPFFNGKIHGFRFKFSNKTNPLQLGLLLYTHTDLSTSRIFHLYDYGEICSKFDGYFPVTYIWGWVEHIITYYYHLLPSLGE